MAIDEDQTSPVSLIKWPFYASAGFILGFVLFFALNRPTDQPLDQWQLATCVLASALASSVTDNIPLAAMLAKILGSMPAGEVSPGLWWAVIFGANLGGNLTPIGSASTLVAVTIMHKHELTMTFGRFVKMAIPFALMHIALALVYVLTFL